MDNFEEYLFGRITDLKGRIIDEENSVADDETKKAVLFYLRNTLDEVVEIFANYNLNYKIWS